MSESIIVTSSGNTISRNEVLIPGGNREVAPGESSSRIVHIPRRPTPLDMRRAKAIYRLQTRKGPERAQDSDSAA